LLREEAQMRRVVKATKAAVLKGKSLAGLGVIVPRRRRKRARFDWVFEGLGDRRKRHRLLLPRIKSGVLRAKDEADFQRTDAAFEREEALRKAILAAMPAELRLALEKQEDAIFDEFKAKIHKRAEKVIAQELAKKARRRRTMDGLGESRFKWEKLYNEWGPAQSDRFTPTAKQKLLDRQRALLPFEHGSQKKTLQIDIKKLKKEVALQASKRAAAERKRDQALIDGAYEHVYANSRASRAALRMRRSRASAARVASRVRRVDAEALKQEEEAQRLLDSEESDKRRLAEQAAAAPRAAWGTKTPDYGPGHRKAWDQHAYQLIKLRDRGHVWWSHPHWHLNKRGEWVFEGLGWTPTKHRRELRDILRKDAPASLHTLKQAGTCTHSILLFQDAVRAREQDASRRSFKSNRVSPKVAALLKRAESALLRNCRERSSRITDFGAREPLRRRA